MHIDIDIHIAGEPVKVDLDRLTATARSLAEAIADAPGRDTVDIWMEADAPIRDTTPGWEHWFTEDEAARPERRPWRGWSTQPLNGADPHARLEREAKKIPAGWHVLGTDPQTELTADKVIEVLARHGRRITAATWRSYVNRNQVPSPAKLHGRTPVWYLKDIEEWVRDPRRRK